MKNINKIIKEIPQIANGIKNYVIKDEEIEQLHEQRISICKTCDKYNAMAKRCMVCGCLMEVKTRSEKAQCPLRKW